MAVRHLKLLKFVGNGTLFLFLLFSIHSFIRFLTRISMPSTLIGFLYSSFVDPEQLLLLLHSNFSI